MKKFEHYQSINEKDFIERNMQYENKKKEKIQAKL